ncbi:hypothetical protein CH63R_08801 [Colletotrichum higginsianum IMI 349063]|uniref:Uncharacterized protein n=2 Tax=Colletotrichum higginsianum TaxID=80884 RepID=A0A1B7Y5H2_COLHI|nr:hypothetical protein CH63R_08801 [Colletotrichum higginsianum IMI 349063]OBR07280.1 hypothetical protein CH63R_08801 [Colletotrichum higginsianum IMI 349063]TIC92405.1 hypothetical protein CH35J_010270 [Colletotrichum higginsianum]
MATTPACFPSFRLWARFQPAIRLLLAVLDPGSPMGQTPAPRPPPLSLSLEMQAAGWAPLASTSNPTHCPEDPIHNLKPSTTRTDTWWARAKFVPDNLPNLTNLDTAWPMICTWAPSTWPLALVRDGRKWDRSGSSINMGS